MFQKLTFSFYKWEVRKKREIKDVSLVLDLRNWLSDSIIQCDWLSRQKEKKKKRFVGKSEEFYFIQIKFKVTHLSGNEWINEPMDLFMINKSVSELELLSNFTVSLGFLLIIRSQRIFHWTIVLKYYIVENNVRILWSSHLVYFIY